MHIRLTFRILALVQLSSLLLGCSGNKSERVPEHISKLKNLKIYSPNAEPANKIILQREITYGSTDSVLIGRLGGVAVGNSGRVFIGDPQQYRIDVFEPDGKYLTHFGGKGRGPGEFEANPFAYIVSDQLYVYDPIARRISIFSLNSFRIIQTININPVNWDHIKALKATYIQRIFFRNDGEFVVSFSQWNTKPPTSPGQKIDTLYRLYYLMNDKGQIISGQILKQRDFIQLTASIDGRIHFASNFLFLNKPLATVSNDGHIFVAGSEYFLVKEYDPNGKYLRAFFYPYKKLKLTREAALRSEVYKNFPPETKNRQSFIKQNELPETWPALANMIIDDKNRLWISTIIKNQKEYRWWILNRNGKLLARFNWPRDKIITMVKNKYLYTRETNKKTGREQIVRYRIEMEPSKKPTL